MKFTLMFKTPDVLDRATESLLDTHCNDCDEYNPDCKLCIPLQEEACQKVEAICRCAKKFIEYGEYLRVELDTETGTATVIPI